MIAVCDLQAGWSFDGPESAVLGIRFNDGGSERIYPDALSFGWTAVVNGEALGGVYPPDDSVVRELSPKHVFEFALDALPDDEVELSVWVENGGQRFDGSITYTIERSSQPHPSWVWSEGGWVAPVPYPSDNSLYVWDESEQSWVAPTVEGL
jgi:hypothetical protein